MKNKTILMVLASIMSFRMLGLFMILPVFSVYAEHIAYATPTLIGLALGIYGLTQACLQIPFGLLSDHVGRKRVVLMGLSLFFMGSVVAALSHSIYFLIVGRALQGAGAIGSTVLAWVADITPMASRGKAMAFIGLTIGLAFTVAMILGPMINHGLHLSGIFWVTAFLALVGMGLVLNIPVLPRVDNRAPISMGLMPLLRNTALLRLDFGIFSLHAILTALFIVIPIILTKKLLLTASEQIILYCVILILGFIFALPFIIFAEKKQKIKTVFMGGVVALLVAIIVFMFFPLPLPLPLTLFFTAFTLLEALLPSLVSKTAPPEKKGAAMGVYSTCQFLGIFVGGTVGGMVFAHAHIMGVFALCAVIAAVWLVVLYRQ